MMLLARNPISQSYKLLLLATFAYYLYLLGLILLFTQMFSLSPFIVTAL